ncbi:MAG: LptF/LptG family permease [Verrucomicrobiaceae bacterium]|nr:LptF/LptG family permease [Verrucomicrobiaceae bacterium]
MFLRIFDRYLARQIGMATLIGVALLSGVMVLGNVYKKLDELLGNTELPISVVLEFVALVIPFSLIYTIPWAFLTGILLVFGRLSADNELVSLRMTGMSMPRICLPVFGMAVLLSAVCFYVNVDLAPAAKDRMKRLFYRVVADNPETLFQEGQVLDKMPGYRIYTGKRNGTELKDLHIMQINGPTTAYIRATDATLHAKPGSLDFMLNLRDEHLEQAGSGPSDKTQALGFNSKWLSFSLAKLQEDTVRINASMKSTPALSQEVSSGKDCFTGAELTPVQKSLSNTELNKRYSFSLASITFALVGIPLGITAQRRETSMGFVIGIATALAYMSFIILAEALGEKPGAMPHLLMWLPNVLFLGIGAWMFRKLSRK